MDVFKMKLIKRIYRVFKFSLKLNQISRYSDDKLETQFRKKTHSVENSNKEKKFNFFSTMMARALFVEAKKRDIISKNEIDWGNNVLYGEPRQTSEISSYDVKDTKEDLLRIIKTRRSVRRWTDEKISEDDFKLMIDAARWAPSSCNRQAWHYIVTQDKDKIELLYKARKQNIIKNAPCCILVTMNTEAYQYKKEELIDHYMLQDAAAAIQNLLLMAHYLDLGACWVNLAANNVTEESKNKIRKRFDIPRHFELITLILVGKTDSLPAPPGRKDIEDILHFEKFKIL